MKLDLNVQTFNEYLIMLVVRISYQSMVKECNINTLVLSLVMYQKFLYVCTVKFMRGCGLKRNYFPVMFNGGAWLSSLCQNDSRK